MTEKVVFRRSLMTATQRRDGYYMNPENVWFAAGLRTGQTAVAFRLPQEE